MDVIAILEKLQSLGYMRLNKISGNYYQIYCPIHNDGNERKPSCGVLLVDQYKNGNKYPAGFCHCFACNYAKSLPDTITDILKNKNINKSGLDWLTENVPGFTIESDDYEHLIPNETSELLSSKFAIDYIQSLSNTQSTFISEEELSSYRFTVPYMYERHLTDDIISKYDIGYDANWIPPGRKKPVPCITFPVRDIKGRTLFFCRRSIQGKLFNYPTGVTKPLYGIDMIPDNCKELFICESCINALTLATWGYDAVALMGTGNTYQMTQLKQLNIPSIVVCLDGDDAGKRGTTKIKKYLSQVSMVWSITMPDGKDINDIDKSTFEQLYQERE